MDSWRRRSCSGLFGTATFSRFEGGVISSWRRRPRFPPAVRSSVALDAVCSSGFALSPDVGVFRKAPRGLLLAPTEKPTARYLSLMLVPSFKETAFFIEGTLLMFPVYVFRVPAAPLSDAHLGRYRVTVHLLTFLTSSPPHLPHLLTFLTFLTFLTSSSPI
ncbi:hypothetical protein EYF80_043595 [Liparis tanakae]|uniref:Uncharacterized protein n=1 Tax=Liparis tanakae TaxID=230148 RepID=A0A4Z2FY41_9TELE|nr:hypothetical protein EYF80_043595 [Liparis tanakae]